MSDEATLLAVRMQNMAKTLMQSVGETSRAKANQKIASVSSALMDEADYILTYEASWEQTDSPVPKESRVTPDEPSDGVEDEEQAQDGNWRP